MDYDRVNNKIGIPIQADRAHILPHCFHLVQNVSPARTSSGTDQLIYPMFPTFLLFKFG